MEEFLRQNSKHFHKIVCLHVGLVSEFNSLVITTDLREGVNFELHAAPNMVANCPITRLTPVFDHGELNTLWLQYDRSTQINVICQQIA